MWCRVRVFWPARTVMTLGTRMQSEVLSAFTAEVAGRANGTAALKRRGALSDTEGADRAQVLDALRAVTTERATVLPGRSFRRHRRAQEAVGTSFTRAAASYTVEA